MLKDFQLTVNPEPRALTRQELMDQVRGLDALLCLLTDGIDAELLDAAGPQLKIVANYAVGYNNIDIAAANARNVLVANTPGVLTEATADLAWTLLMSAARCVGEGERMVRAGRFSGWEPMMLLGAMVHGRTLGVIGFGRIGQAVARRASGFNMRILYTDAARASQEVERGACYVDLPTLLAESDFISLHVPLNEVTRHMIGAKQLKMMKRTAVLVNSARGPIVDEAALVDALKEGVIAAAGLDVYEREPELAPGLAQAENAVLLPHLGSATAETRAQMAALAAGAIVAVLAGRKPDNLVNPDVWPKRRK